MAARKASPMSRFVVYVFTSIVAPIVVSVVSGSIKDKNDAAIRPPAPPQATVTLLPPAPEPSVWESYYRPAPIKRIGTVNERR